VNSCTNLSYHQTRDSVLSAIRRRTDVFAPAICLAVFLATSIAYAWKQSLWLDEATQLSGIQLDFSTQLEWLLGAEVEALHVPHDRTPPLSYWIGRAWFLALGPNEFTMRLLGITAVFCGLVALYRGVCKSLGQRVGVAALAFCCLSPGLIFTATEIRPYGLFFLFSVMVLDACVRFVDRGPSPQVLIYLCAGCVAGTFTHFFGLLMSCAALGILVARHFLYTRKISLALAATAVAYLLISSLLVFLVLAAISLSNEAPKQLTLPEYLVRNIKLAYRLASYQTMTRIPGGGIIAFLCAVTLLAFGVAGFRRLPHVATVLAILVAGFGIASASSILIHNFDPLTPHYNVWMIPFTAIGIAAGTVTGTEFLDRRRWLPFAIFGVLLGIAALGDTELIRNGPAYGHTRSQDLRQIVDRLGTENVIVIYMNDGGKTYFPMHYWYGNTLSQYELKSERLVNTWSNENVDELPKTRYLILAATRDLGARQLRETIVAGSPLSFPRPDGKLDQIVQGYSITEELMFPAQEALLVTIYTIAPAQAKVARETRTGR